MITGLAALVLLRTVYLIQTAEVSHQMSLTEVEVGGNVTLQCPISAMDGNFFYWHKQSPGYIVQTVASSVGSKLTVSEQFSRYTLTQEGAQYFLTIKNISKEDEATHFCQNAAVYLSTLVGVTFLAVKDHNQQKSFHVKQSPETEWVQQGDPVTLQCSLLSKNKENTAQCPAEHSVHWFRSGSGGSHPDVLYTHSDEQEERSCVHSLSKTIQDSSDTGTYYCAVVTCGQILFGEGTKVETRSELDPVVLVLGVLLACCVTVIASLTYVVNRGKVCNHCKGALSSSHNLGHDRSTVDQSNDLDDEENAMNYAALNFSTRKVKRGKKRETPPECVYSAVRADNHNQHLPSP
ncbi:uncharacterized protein LOC131981372 [Centropristis striata]|uniref:uncharacterized protein LOC131981372 n=1 Tax=Centropristis striata TaxID=184440 RepID=UPI0027E1A971|nr:uncharacterized protein LOC131981372 [Centropristis striata]